MSPLDKRIHDAWEALDADSVSTERLMSMVADRCGVDVGRVAEAMSRHPDAVHSS